MAKAVIFDFDGVIVDSEPLHYRTFSEALAPLGVSIERASWYRDFAGTGSRAIIERLLEENGIKADVEALIERRKSLFAGYAGKGALRPTSGLRVFLRRIRSAGMKTAVASGGHRDNIEQILTGLGLLSQFDAIVGFEDVRNRKPHPEIFLAAARRLSVEPGDCIVIEDSVPGCEAAGRAGMRLVLMDSPAAPMISGYDMRIRDFRGLDAGLLGLAPGK